MTRARCALIWVAAAWYSPARLAAGTWGAQDCTGIQLGGSGSWSNGRAWDTCHFPNSLGELAVIDGNKPVPSAVFLDVNPSVGGLVLDSDSKLIMPSQSTLTVGGNIVNAGEITLSAGASATTLFLADNISLSGGGKITLSNAPLNRFSATVSQAYTLTNLDNTIQGAGLLSVNNIGINNHALIDANETLPLILDPGSPGVTNTGTLRGSAGSTLQLLSGAYNNNGGTMLANGAGANVSFNQAIVSGGHLTATGGGLLEINGETTFDSVVLTGPVQVDNAVRLTVQNSITNTGTISLNASGGATSVVALAAGTTLDGGGTLQMGNDHNNIITGSGALTNVNNTIRGSGQIGTGTLTLVNQSLILADQSTPLIVDPGAGGMTNTGLMLAQGGIMQLNAGTYHNSGGFIEAIDAGAIVKLNGAVIEGGTVFADKTGSSKCAGANPVCGLIEVIANSALDGVSTHGGINIDNNATLTLKHTITNLGIISINATTLSAEVILGTDVVLAGDGIVRLGNNNNSRIRGSNNILTNQQFRIDGGGQLGFGSIGIINETVIEANQSTPLVLHPNGSGVINTGTMRAVGGAALELLSGTFDNTGGGTILASGAGSAVKFSNAVVKGGILSSSLGGVLEVLGVTGSTFDGITLKGALQVDNTANATLKNTITNAGLISLNASTSFSDLLMSGDVRLEGAGLVTMSDNVNNRIRGLAGSTLTNVDNTIRGSGGIGFNVLGIVNQGTIWANQTTALTIDPGAAGFFNSGTLKSSAGSTLSIVDGFLNYDAPNHVLNGGTYFVGGTFSFPGADIITNQAAVILDGASSQILNRTNSANGLTHLANNGANGSFTVQNGRTFALTTPFTNAGAVNVGTASQFNAGSYTQTGGSTVVDGTLSAPVIDIQGGTLSGSGHIVGSVHNGGSISPGHSPGLLEIEGDYVQLSEATLIMQLGGLAAGTEYDLLQIGGNAALDGTLNLELWDGFHPSDGNLFTILTFLSRGGSRFATVNGLQIAGGHFDLAYNAQDVTLRFAADPTPEPGTVVLWIGGLAALAWLRRRY